MVNRDSNENRKVTFLKQKILKQVEYESARRKRHINGKTRKRDEEGSAFFFVHLSRELKETKEKLKGTQGNSREALVEVMEGKKLRKRGKEGKFHK